MRDNLKDRKSFKKQQLLDVEINCLSTSSTSQLKGWRCVNVVFTACFRCPQAAKKSVITVLKQQFLLVLNTTDWLSSSLLWVFPQTQPPLSFFFTLTGLSWSSPPSFCLHSSSCASVNLYWLLPVSPFHLVPSLQHMFLTQQCLNQELTLDLLEKYRHPEKLKTCLVTEDEEMEVDYDSVWAV